jgi:cation transport ATPase
MVLLRLCSAAANAAGAELLPTLRRAVQERRSFTRTHVDSALVKLRLPGRRADVDTTSDASEDLTAQLVKAEGKGRPTPKRSEAQGRRQGPPPPPPTTRKEAYRRMRENQASNRGYARQAAMRGEEDYLPARDRGPERRLVRKVVDSRRNIASIFLIVVVLMLVAQFTPSVTVRSYTVILWIGFFAVIVVDSFVLARKIRRTVLEQFPKTKVRLRSLSWYGISRSTMIRRWRFPKPEVELGAEI